MIKNIFFTVILLHILQACTPMTPSESSFERKKLIVDKSTEYYWIEWPKKNLSNPERQRLTDYFRVKCTPNCHIRFASNLPADKSLALKGIFKTLGFDKTQIAMDPFIPQNTDLLSESDLQQCQTANVFGVAIDTYKIISPSCPDWSMVYQDKDHTKIYSNFGCAEAQSLAAMIENPKDLVRPLSPTYTSGDFIEGSLQKYKTANSQTTDAKQGSSISELGKSAGK